MNRPPRWWAGTPRSPLVENPPGERAIVGVSSSGRIHSAPAAALGRRSAAHAIDGHLPAAVERVTRVRSHARTEGTIDPACARQLALRAPEAGPESGQE